MTDPRPFTVRPRVWIGLAIYVGYVAVFYGILALSGVPYTRLGDRGSNLLLGGGVPLIVGAVLLVITTTLLGWWRPALFDQHRSRARWPIIAPILLALAVLANLIATDWASYDLAHGRLRHPRLERAHHHPDRQRPSGPELNRGP